MNREQPTGTGPYRTSGDRDATQPQETSKRESELDATTTENRGEAEQLSEPVLVHPRKVRRVAFPVAIALVIVFALVGTLLRNTPTGAVFSVSDQVAMGLLGVLLAAGVLLLTRPRLRADADGVEVRNIVGTQRFEWPLVQAISFPDGAPWARLELPEDEYVPIMAIQATDGQHAVQAMRQLRALRRQLEP